MEPCYYCKGASTHRCAACGHMICDSPICAGLAAIEVAKAVRATVVASVRRVLNQPPISRFR